MKVKRILSFLLVVVIAVSLVGCTSSEYCSSPSEAYENNKTQNSAIYIKRGITRAQVSDDVIIWVAHNNKTDIVLAPMMASTISVLLLWATQIMIINIILPVKSPTITFLIFQENV